MAGVGAPERTADAVGGPPQAARSSAPLRRIFAIWCLIFFNALTPSQGAIVPIPHRVAQVLTQGSLALALVLVLTVNPRLRVRPNWFLGLYTLLATTSLMMSVRLVGLGTAFRSFRLIAILAVLWLLTPWWGRRDLVVLRCQMRFLLVILASVVLGLFISPGKAMPQGRLSGSIWPIWSTQVAHYGAEVAGLCVVLWASRLLTGTTRAHARRAGNGRPGAHAHAHCAPGHAHQLGGRRRQPVLRPTNASAKRSPL